MTDMTFAVLLDGNKTADLQVEEHVPYEPSAYQWEAGWRCYDLNTDTEYFVSEGGEVWKQPENRVVGVCPAVRAAAERMEALLDEAMGND